MGWKSWINPRVSCFINGFEEGLVSEWGWGFHEFVELFEATKNRWDFCVLWFPSNRILLYQWSILEKTWTNYQDSRTTPKNKWSVACISVDCYFNAASFFPSLAYSGCAFLTYVSCICFVFFQIWRFLEQPKLQLQYTKGTLPLLLEAVFKQPKGILFIASPVFNDGQSWSCCVRRHQRKWTGNMKLK